MNFSCYISIRTYYMGKFLAKIPSYLAKILFELS